MGYSLIFKAAPYLLPLAGLSIPFLGGQKTEDDFDGGYKENAYGGIYYGPSDTSGSFQNLLNFGKKDTFIEDFMQGKDTSGLLEMDPEAIQDLKDQATLFNKDGDYIGGVLPSGIVENKPTTMLQEQNQILGADGKPISGSSSTTFDNTDISSNNNNNNNDNKDGNNFNKLLYGSLLINPLFEGGKYLFNKAKDMFGKTDDNDGKGKSDFEDITGITYEKAMELQRKRENELMNRRALEGGIKDAGKYMYLAGAAGMEAGKNIGRNTQDMLRSMAYGQSALANTIAGAAKTTPLTRTYFS
mgnify:CR=1 FL=1